MLSTNDFINIFLPVLNHWIIWTSFFVISIFILLLYAYPYIKKPRKEFLRHHIRIPIINVISLYIFTKMLEGVIYQESILKVDKWFNETMVTLQSPWLTKLAFFITSFGSGIPIIVIVTITIGILFLRKRWRFALLSLAAILSTTLLQIVIKNLVNRVRPSDSLEVITPGMFSPSFPSGHAITAIVYLSLLVYSYKDDIKHTATKHILITATSIFFISVGLTRVYLNAHWFSDVIAGMALGLFWFMSVVLVERSITGLIPAIRIESKKAKLMVPEVLKK
ncbi:phosphatase PAP2 family protein [Candidatus Woesearchaeota archaeon]|nr:phosphatase PAP2 family protein [Candidatus Woesearchaeota archaeon]